MSLENFIRKNKEAFDADKMPDHASSDFEKRLMNELHRPNRSRRLLSIKSISIAASIALLLSLGYSYNLKKEAHQERRDHLVNALSENQTNSTRLAAIYEIEDLYKDKKEDEKILAAFFKILKSNSSSNSKIAVIDALLEFPENPTVRDNIIEALAEEKEPLVQLKLIKAVVILREQRAKAPLQKIIKNEDSLPLVKGNASASLAMLNQ